jgi:hypothetical protein
MATQVYELDTVTLELDDDVIDTSRLTYLRDSEQGATDAFGSPAREERTADAEEAIADLLADGPRKSREVKTAVMDELDVGQRTVERAAANMADRGELVVTQGGFPRTTTWALTSGVVNGATPITVDGATGGATGETSSQSQLFSGATNGAKDGDGVGATGVPCSCTGWTARMPDDTCQKCGGMKS